MIATPAKQELVIAAPELRGGNLELGACRDIEVLLDGPAGTGKTYAALYKIHTMLSFFPGAKALVARKSNTALAGSALATYRDHILRPEENVAYFGGNKVRPAAFMYPNGSILVVNGLDKPSKVKSWEFDLAFINEATEITVEDLEFVRSRLRNGVTPYQQVIMDANPDAPQHWLNVRCNDGVTTRILSRHEDNPRFHDGADWTPEGYQYIFETLGGLTGVRLSRLRYGLWVAAEGTVYEESWDRARNVVNKEHIPAEWPRYLAIDFGFTNPFVCLWAALDPDGRLIIYRQLYHTKRLVEDHAADINIASGWFNRLPREHPRYKEQHMTWADPLPRAIICDHDAEDRATLERHLSLYTTKAEKNVSAGIQAVASRLKPAGDGKSRIQVFRDCLIEKDRELADTKRPTCLEDEPESYIWDTRQNMKRGDQPVKENDHAMDALRYLVAYFDLVPSSVKYSQRIY